MSGNYGAEVVVLNARRLAGSGRGACPETPRRFGVQTRPEKPHSSSRFLRLRVRDRKECAGFTNPTTRGDIRMPNIDRDGARARVLLVDDEEDARELATLTLAEYTLITLGHPNV
jgi:hypothetical protein